MRTSTLSAYLRVENETSGLIAIKLKIFVEIRYTGLPSVIPVETCNPLYFIQLLDLSPYDHSMGAFKSLTVKLFACRLPPFYGKDLGLPPPE